jgi:hypothetical protein
MTDPQQQHRATPEQWASIDDPENPFAYEVCILELRDRIAALEAAQAGPPPTIKESLTVPTGSLVERVASICASGSDDEPEVWKPEARAAIREVAAWLDTKGQHGCSLWLREEIELLDLEAKR